MDAEIKMGTSCDHRYHHLASATTAIVDQPMPISSTPSSSEEGYTPSQMQCPRHQIQNRDDNYDDATSKNSGGQSRRQHRRRCRLNNRTPSPTSSPSPILKMATSLALLLLSTSSQWLASAQTTPTPTIQSTSATTPAVTPSSITAPPITASSPPASSSPTLKIITPTTSPSPAPSSAPSISTSPSSPPSVPPTNYPTITPHPSLTPSLSLAPTSPPSTSGPTISPTPAPSASPVVPPTMSPSTNVTLSIQRECNQILEVNSPLEFNEVEVGIYQLQMQSYTDQFGDMLGVPFVVTECLVTEQNLAGGRRRKTTTTRGERGRGMIESGREVGLRSEKNKKKKGERRGRRIGQVNYMEDLEELVYLEEFMLWNDGLNGHDQTDNNDEMREQVVENHRLGSRRRLERSSEKPGGFAETMEETSGSKLRLSNWLNTNPTTKFTNNILQSLPRFNQRKNNQRHHQYQHDQNQNQQQQQHDRSLQTTTTKILLVMQFTIEYESKYGIEIDNYPSLFQEYINSHLDEVTSDMQTRFLPVVAAREVIVYNTKEPTLSPTQGGTIVSALPTPAINPPTPSGGSMTPTTGPSASPIAANATKAPTDAPSLSPQTYVSTPSPTPVKADIIEDNTSFIVGLAAGLSGAALVVLLFICYKRRERKKKLDGTNTAIANGQEAMRRNDHLNGPRASDEDNNGVEMTAEEAMMVGQGGGLLVPGEGNGEYGTYKDGLEYPPPDGGVNNSGISMEQSQQNQQQQNAQGTIADSIFSNPSMVSGGGSFSSKEEDNHAGGGVQLDPLQDEFDSYKNQDLEFMRNGVEESVYGAEGMMSLAMTRALMEDEESDVDLTWGGAEDPESIEANCLCETHDWLRKNEHSSLDERNQFFQDILSRMVVTVRKSLIRPNDGTRTIHCCAAMLGLRLEKELPNNVLIVTGMRKTNNLSEGRFYLVEAFKSFGDIEGGAIAPSNRGFGFVRFAHPKSVQRALQSFRVSEIEVQDVSVMIKALKSDSPGI